MGGVVIGSKVTRPLNRVVAGLTEGVEQLNAGSEQITSASQSLAEGASEQAASLEETSSSMEEMAASTRQNAERAGQADALMETARQVIEGANGAVSDLSAAMTDIDRAGGETGTIIKTIDEIAFQTNLLALNAAVEAARAGEAGAGFAVVADEVRSLALRAAKSAKTTADLIDDTIRKVREGGQYVEKTREAFGAVNETVDRVAELLSQISYASDEQARGIEQVSSTVSQMDQVTHRNAANAEETASAAQGLFYQAEQLSAHVDDLNGLLSTRADRKAGRGGG